MTGRIMRTTSRWTAPAPTTSPMRSCRLRRMASFAMSTKRPACLNGGSRSCFIGPSPIQARKRAERGRRSTAKAELAFAEGARDLLVERLQEILQRRPRIGPDERLGVHPGDELQISQFLDIVRRELKPDQVIGSAGLTISWRISSQVGRD